MNSKSLYSFLRKKIKVHTKNKYYFIGEIIEISDNDIIFDDKEGKRVVIPCDEITLVEEVID